MMSEQGLAECGMAGEARPTLLVVGDLDGDVALLAQGLGDDFRVLFARGGTQGLEFLAAPDPLDPLGPADPPDPPGPADCILLAAKAGEADGFTLYSQLKADPRTCDIPVLFLAAGRNRQDEARSLALGAADFIAKPFALSAVKARVRNHVALRRTNQALRESEERCRTLVESMQEGLLMAGKSGRVRFVNKRLADMLGRSKDDILGRPAEDFAAPESKQRLAAMLSGEWAGQGSEEIVWTSASDRRIFTLVSPSTLLDEAGRFAGAYAIATDTTERKALESHMLQSQKLEAIGQLAAGIAHEINTPTQYVSNNVSFLKEAFEHLAPMCHAFRSLLAAAKSGHVSEEEVRAAEEAAAKHNLDFLAEEVPSAIAQTIEGVNRISLIVRSVKQFAHPGSSDMAPADLNEAMRSTVIVSNNEWKYAAELKTDLDPDLPLVECVISEINQVALNLIINAVHAITEAIQIDPQGVWTITLSTRRNGPWAEIRVADTGSGIPVEAQPKVFDPFFTTKGVGKGTGQGLSISRRIVVEKHHGQIFFETEPGKGTTFIVRLPLKRSRGEP